MWDSDIFSTCPYSNCSAATSNLPSNPTVHLTCNSTYPRWSNSHCLNPMSCQPSLSASSMSTANAADDDNCAICLATVRRFSLCHAGTLFTALPSLSRFIHSSHPPLAACFSTHFAAPSACVLSRTPGCATYCRRRPSCYDASMR